MTLKYKVWPQSCTLLNLFRLCCVWLQSISSVFLHVVFTCCIMEAQVVLLLRARRLTIRYLIFINLKQEIKEREKRKRKRGQLHWWEFIRVINQRLMEMSLVLEVLCHKPPLKLSTVNSVDCPFISSVLGTETHRREMLLLILLKKIYLIKLPAVPCV